MLLECAGEILIMHKMKHIEEMPRKDTLVCVPGVADVCLSYSPPPFHVRAQIKGETKANSGFQLIMKCAKNKFTCFCMPRN